MALSEKEVRHAKVEDGGAFGGIGSPREAERTTSPATLRGDPSPPKVNHTPRKYSVGCKDRGQCDTI